MKTVAYLMLIMMALTFFLTLGSTVSAEEDDGLTVGSCEVFRSLPAALCLTVEGDDGGLAEEISE
ncbi:MAG TPA: hypothetical protein PLP49_01225 [Anaerohalosphaeraceae bacterium]|jgi:hypothetical protein|nr:hypothetical protein [Anaerohalosphaeraceae bacterium]HPB92735.1 hypothetical protein [Anaerohalosphaeraceae bacterium]HRT22882.1 hypothetical protein [Anaerohalosphaeraceae bacterium]HRU14818.1 hypothetical protein [Anaerohalosphaeraceae bacterium]